jgi:hypothetical protein
MRQIYLGVRLTADERATLEQLAQHEERTPSDTVRRLLREKAAQLGITPAKEDRRPNEAGVCL